MSPVPKSMFTVNAGEEIVINLGVPMSTNGEEVEVELLSGGIGFMNFDENSMVLSIDQGVTTNDDTGVYTIEITLREVIDDL